MTELDLPDAELDVMSCLWRTDAMTAREVREQLQPTRPMTHASVCTLLKRLEDKGLVNRRKASSGKAFVYTASVAPTKTQRRLVRDLVDRMFAGSGVALVASLLHSRRPTDAEIVELQSLLDELKQNTARQPKGSK